MQNCGHGAHVLAHQDFVQDVDSFQEQDGGDGNWNAPRRVSQLPCLQGLAQKKDRGLTRVTDAQCFSFHDEAESTWEFRFDVLVVRLSGGGSLCSSLVVPATIQVRGATTEKEHVSALVNKHLDMEVSGVKRSFVMSDFSPTPWRAMSTDMARDCGSTAKRLPDRRLLRVALTSATDGP